MSTELPKYEGNPRDLRRITFARSRYLTAKRAVFVEDRGDANAEAREAFRKWAKGLGPDYVARVGTKWTGSVNGTAFRFVFCIVRPAIQPCPNIGRSYDPCVEGRMLKQVRREGTGMGIRQPDGSYRPIPLEWDEEWVECYACGGRSFVRLK